MSSTTESKQGRLKVKLVIAAISIVVSIGSLEISLRCYDYLINKGLHRRDNEFIFFKYDSILGWKNKPNAKGIFSMPDSRTHVKINSKGLRDREYEYVKTKKLRILILGDSFAWGFGIEENERFSEILETRYLKNRIDVINAGVSGYGTDQELLFLSQEGLKYQPDIVILLFGPDDCEDNSTTVAYTYPKPHYILKDDNLTLTNVPVPPKENWDKRQNSKGLLRSLRLYSFITDRLNRLGFLQNKKLKEKADREKIEITKRLLVKIKRLTDSKSITLVVLLKPYYLLQTVSPLYNEFKDFLISKGFMVCDPLPDLINESYKGKKFRFKHDVHWNATGNRIVAKVLYKYLVNKKLLIPKN